MIQRYRFKKAQGVNITSPQKDMGMNVKVHGGWIVLPPPKFSMKWDIFEQDKYAYETK